MLNFNRTCLRSKSGDSSYFGTSHYWGYVEPIRSFPLPRKTLIKSLNNGSTKIIESRGTLSLSNSILAIKSPEKDKSYQSRFFKIFRLDDNAAPHLILELKDFEDAWVQNNYLITVELSKKRTVSNVYIETIS